MGEPVCDFCGAVRAVVYCDSDRARLCLQCDDFVHSANYLSLKHIRSLLCEKCVSQAAVVRCLDDNMSLCHLCDGGGCFCSPDHRRVDLDFYTGCPSLVDLSKIWSFVLDCPVSQGSSGGEAAGGPSSGGGGVVANKLNEIASCVKFGPWGVPSQPQTPPPPPQPQLPCSYGLLSSFASNQKLETTSFNSDQLPFLSKGSALQKVIANCHSVCFLFSLNSNPVTNCKLGK